MENGEAWGDCICLQLVGIRHHDTIWSGDPDFIANGGILGKRPGGGGGQVKSEDAQDGGEVDHLHDLKE